MGAKHTGDFGLNADAAKAIKDLEAGDGFSAEGAVTADTGSAQGDSYNLVKTMTRVETVANAGDSVQLPAAVAGMIRIVSNKAAANSMDVFPSSGDTINALSADAAYAVAVTKTVFFCCFKDGQWDTVLTA